MGIGETSVEGRCDHCEHPDISLLRVVLIGEIIRAEEDDLYALVEIFDELGLLDLSDDDDTPPEAQPPTRSLRRVK